MVYRWSCRQCEYTVWSAAESSLVESVESHQLDHYRNRVSRDEFSLSWDCPYCDRSDEGYDSEKGIRQFRRHLYEHVEALVESDVHVAGEISGTGDVLVRAPLDSTGADNARVHFTALADVALFVTADPARYARLLSDQLSSWPAWTVMLTTKEQPFAGVDDVDVASAPMEVVVLDKGMGIKNLGVTVSRVLDEQDTGDARVAVGFDVLGELVELYDPETVFKFAYVLNDRLSNVDALTHYYMDPRRDTGSVVNVFENLFDLRLTADGDTFVSES